MNLKFFKILANVENHTNKIWVQKIDLSVIIYINTIKIYTNIEISIHFL